ncbi:MAG TPA: hypothetical protein VFM67_03320 [Gaiella sp.]|nr:hypothetical protein [Gaiella sp.]
MRTTRRIGALWTLAAAALASLATVLVLPTGSGAVTQAAPTNTAEPRISGSATVGSTLSTTQGTWTGSPTSYAYQWVRCPRGGGLPSGSDCASIGGATTTKYIVAAADVDHRLRVRVTASNTDGSKTVASNATALVRAADEGRPVNTQAPALSGTAAQGQVLHVTPGTWNGQQPITYTFRWLRCDTAGNNCIIQQGFQDDAYALREGDVGKTIRARVIARNSRGEANKLTAPTATVQGPQTPPGPAGVITLPNGEKSIPVTSVPSDQRLVVDQVQFSPSPVRSRTAPITVRVKVKDTRGYVVRDALVFLRSTPLVTKNAQDQKTGQDGWLQLTVTPERDFPELRPAYSVQFFVKAYRQGDPELAGVAGYRLVQVPLG